MSGEGRVRLQRPNRDLKVAMAFLMPNFLGFCVFTAGPVVFSLVVAFTNWNLMRTVPFEWIGSGNFREMFADQEFWLYFINTGYLMLGMPLAIAGSLGLALLLTRKLRGIVVFRTLFYLPTFTAGVALLILWKALYNPDSGPINRVIEYCADGLTYAGASWPGWLFRGGALAMIALAAAVVARRVAKGSAAIRGSQAGAASSIWLVLAAAPAVWIVSHMGELGWPRWVVLVGVAGLVVARVWYGTTKGAAGTPPRSAAAVEGSGKALALALGCALLSLLPMLLALGLSALPSWSSTAFEAPKWLSSTRNLLGLRAEIVGVSARSWGVGAREALIVMGVWIAIGGNNMLLYIAALTNIPQELYEAAQIDGAGRWAMFWNVTWPQLAPTTFFIVVMSCIGGLQGGFQQARVMTEGGPAGTTTTLAYYIYVKAFQEFQIGYASAVAWVLFSIIFAVTLLNWKFGAKELTY